MKPHASAQRQNPAYQGLSHMPSPSHLDQSSRPSLPLPQKKSHAATISLQESKAHERHYPWARKFLLPRLRSFSPTPHSRRRTHTPHLHSSSPPWNSQTCPSEARKSLPRRLLTSFVHQSSPEQTRNDVADEQAAADRQQIHTSQAPASRQSEAQRREWHGVAEQTHTSKHEKEASRHQQFRMHHDRDCDLTWCENRQALDGHGANEIDALSLLSCLVATAASAEGASSFPSSAASFAQPPPKEIVAGRAEHPVDATGEREPSNASASDQLLHKADQARPSKLWGMPVTVHRHTAVCPDLS